MRNTILKLNQNSNMNNKLILALAVLTLIIGQTVAQNTQSAHQFTQSCYVATNGKIIVNAGGHYTTSISEQVFLRDSLHGSMYDTVSNSFKTNKKSNFSYDAGGLLVASESSTLDKNGVSWTNSIQAAYKYTGFQLNEESFKSWDKTLASWINYTRYLYSYETDNTLTSIFNQPWDADSLVWKYSTKDLITYDQNMNVTSVANQKWNKNLNSWDNYQQVVFTYSGGYISEKNYRIWNKTTQAWDEYQKESISYSNSKKAEIITQVKPATSGWINYSRQVFVYGNEGLSDITEYLWSGSWTENRKYLYSYNSNNMESAVVTQLWAAHLNSFRNQSREESFYTQRVVFGTSEILSGSFYVNNPVSKQVGFTIGGLVENKSYQVRLVSLNGSLVLNKLIRAGDAITLNSQLPVGIYMLGIQASGTKTSIIKVLITE